ncbi:hypothetical protein [Chamaesiphon sp.]|uniref:hypothetical protein n=1 Tax=Chamaesiphon sp. TaxID=2814140 RepID=UPI0035942FAF
MPTKSRSLLSIEATAATLEKLINVLSNHQKYTILTSIDVGLFLTSIIAAIGCEWGFDLIPMAPWHLGKFVVLEISIKIGLFWAFRIYQQVSKYIDGEFIFTIAKAAIASSVAIAAIANWFIDPAIPASILVSDGMLTLILVIAFQLSIRLTLDKILRVDPGQNSCGVVIYDAGSAGCILAQALAGENGKELPIDCHAALPMGHPKIFCAREAELGWKELSPELSSLLDAASLTAKVLEDKKSVLNV